MSFAFPRIAMISCFNTGSIEEAPVEPGLRDFPGPVRLQATREMILLDVDGRAARAHRIFNSLTLLAAPNQLPDQFDRPRVARTRVGPGSLGPYRLAVDLTGDGAVDHVEVLLAQDDVGLQGRK